MLIVKKNVLQTLHEKLEQFEPLGSIM